MLKHFKIDPKRTKLVVPVQFYQMNLARAVKQARKLDPDLFADGTDMLPGWSKFAKNPVRAKGLWTRMLQATFLGQGNFPELSVDRQTEDDAFESEFKVSMMFLPASMTNANLKKVVTYTEQTLRGHIILEISGAGKYNGKKITNANAEKITNEVIYKAMKTNTPVLILSRGMAQRSYSIGEITNLYLCYDEGDAGATTQKISRALTPDNLDKIGRIYSLSFDPNRDDKFDTIMLAAAQNIAKRKGIEIDEALRMVIDTVDLFACTPDGRVNIDIDTYLEQLMERDSLSRMVGQQANMAVLSDEEIRLLAEGNADYARANKAEIAPTGKTGAKRKLTSKPRSQMNREELKLLDKARKTLVTIIEHLPHLVSATATDTIADCLDYAASNDDYNEYITTEFGLPPASIKALFDRGVINYDLASLQKSTKIKMLKAA